MKKYPHLTFIAKSAGKNGIAPLTPADLDRVYEAVETLSEVFSVDAVEILEELAGNLTENEFDSLRTEFKLNSYDDSTFSNHSGHFAEND